MCWILLPALLLPLTLHAQPTLTESDRIRIAEVFRLAETVQDSVWHGWSEAPIAFLFVTPEHEFLIRHPYPSEDFSSVGYDAWLQSEVYVRDRVFSPNLLATFPAVGGISTIVIGQPENTGKSSTFWVLTALHEHFHQWQTSQPDYYDAVATLDLAGDDDSGMWMLNFPFAYASPDVQTAFAEYQTTLSASLRQRDALDFDMTAYQSARAALQQVLSPDDYAYFSFQLWQEGVARYTEYRVAQTAAMHYEPTDAFHSLPDFIPFEQAADSLYVVLEAELDSMTLDQAQRILFYPSGAAEALLLDAARPGWQARYLREKFYLERYYEPAERR